MKLQDLKDYIIKKLEVFQVSIKFSFKVNLLNKEAFPARLKYLISHLTKPATSVENKNINTWKEK